MPDLGKYAVSVLSAYGVSILLILGLVVLSLRQSARMRTLLRDVEEARKPKESASDG